MKLCSVIHLQYTTLKPLADRVLVKIKSAEQKTTGGILLPSAAQSKPQGGEVVAIGEGRTVGDNKVEVSIQVYFSLQYSEKICMMLSNRINEPYWYSYSTSHSWIIKHCFFQLSGAFVSMYHLVGRFQPTCPKNYYRIIIRCEARLFQPPGT